MIESDHEEIMEEHQQRHIIRPEEIVVTSMQHAKNGYSTASSSNGSCVSSQGSGAGSKMQSMTVFRPSQSASGKRKNCRHLSINS